MHREQVARESKPFSHIARWLDGWKSRAFSAVFVISAWYKQTNNANSTPICDVCDFLSRNHVRRDYMCMAQVRGNAASYTIRSLPVINHQDYSSLDRTLINLRNAVDNRIRSNNTLKNQINKLVSPRFEVTSFRNTGRGDISFFTECSSAHHLANFASYSPAVFSKRNSYSISTSKKMLVDLESRGRNVNYVIRFIQIEDGELTSAFQSYLNNIRDEIDKQIASNHTLELQLGYIDSPCFFFKSSEVAPMHRTDYVLELKSERSNEIVPNFLLKVRARSCLCPNHT
ncbi:hypothetical protein SCHPADRAFT_885872 [Schizopora paradoxa]|uniref:Uncharacterized protein n=1 Tax=Schizopora paradoxa TaxID=27342 RepID=A0A0H2S3V9_9AGAM|nr:hypothetical protein SCHPADRAFT_885872 [Schizopora paradoxa]